MPTQNYCPTHECCIARRDVCERRSKTELAPVWPACTGCSFEDVLTDVPEGMSTIFVFSDPPPMFFNIPKYREALGDAVCEAAAKRYFAGTMFDGPGTYQKPKTKKTTEFFKGTPPKSSKKDAPKQAAAPAPEKEKSTGISKKELINKEIKRRKGE